MTLLFGLLFSFWWFPFTAFCPLLTAYSSLPGAFRPLLSVPYLLPSAFCLLLSFSCLLLSAFCLLTFEPSGNCYKIKFLV